MFAILFCTKYTVSRFDNEVMTSGMERKRLKERSSTLRVTCETEVTFQRAYIPQGKFLQSMTDMFDLIIVEVQIFEM
jgi:hypothetical protein